MALVTFISKDGSRFELDIPQCTHKVELHGSTDKVTGEEVAVLARAMFDRRLSAEAARRGEGNVERALQVMWDRTKTDVRDACMLEAEQTLSLRKPKPRTYRLHTSKAGQTLYIEFGCVFVDLAPKTTAEALDGAIQADIEQQKAELTKRHGLYGVKSTKDKLQGQRVGALNELQKVREMKEAMKALRRKESAEKVQAEWADKPWTNATLRAQIGDTRARELLEDDGKVIDRGCGLNDCVSCNPSMEHIGTCNCYGGRLGQLFGYAPGYNANLKL